MIDDMLAKVATRPEPRRDDVAAPAFEPQFVREGIGKNEEMEGDDIRENVATSTRQTEEVAAMSGRGRDGDATKDGQIEELEKKVRSLEIDKAARDRMIEYLEKNFDKRLEEDRDRDQQLGRLEAENEMLKRMLPPGSLEPQPDLPFEHEGGVES